MKLNRYSLAFSRSIPCRLALQSFGLYAVIGTMCLLCSLGSLQAQTNPDSTAQSGGKGKIKGRAITADSALTDGEVKVMATDTPATDSTVASEDIGPVRKKGKRNRDSNAKLRIRNDRPLPDPKVAVRRALILPGWGQIYNRSWIKLPIVYGGFTVFGILIARNNRLYNQYRRIAVCKGDSTCDDATIYPDFTLFDINSIIATRDGFRRDRDFNIILTALWYTLQAVDAYVTAHLRGFNVSDDLSLHLKPNLMVDPFRNNNLMMGASISLKLRR